MCTCVPGGLECWLGRGIVKGQSLDTMKKISCEHVDSQPEISSHMMPPTRIQKSQEDIPVVSLELSHAFDTHWADGCIMTSPALYLDRNPIVNDDVPQHGR